MRVDRREVSRAGWGGVCRRGVSCWRGGGGGAAVQEQGHKRVKGKKENVQEERLPRHVTNNGKVVLGNNSSCGTNASYSPP
jgi:hypothetical protein